MESSPLQYKFSIGAKKSGNWRPSFRINLKINSASFPHRPFLPTVRLVVKDQCWEERIWEKEKHLEDFSSLEEEYNFFTSKSFENCPTNVNSTHFVFPKWENLYQIHSNEKSGTSMELPFSFKNVNKKGDKDTKYLTNGPNYCFINSSSQKACSCLALTRGGYLESDQEVIKEGYLPWMSGESPDYTAWANIFKVIPYVVQQLLREGEGSGTNKEICSEWNSTLLSSPKEETQLDTLKLRRIKI